VSEQLYKCLKQMQSKICYCKPRPSYAILVYMYYTHSGYQTSIFDKNRTLYSNFYCNIPNVTAADESKTHNAVISYQGCSLGQPVHEMESAVASAGLHP